MAVADDQSVDLTDIDLQNFEVVRINVRREAEVEQVATGLTALARLEMQRQTPLAFQSLALGSLRCPRALNRQPRHLQSFQEYVVCAVGHLTNRQLVDRRRIDPLRSRVCDPLD